MHTGKVSVCYVYSVFLCWVRLRVLDVAFLQEHWNIFIMYFILFWYVSPCLSHHLCVVSLFNSSDRIATLCFFSWRLFVLYVYSSLCVTQPTSDLFSPLYVFPWYVIIFFFFATSSYCYSSVPSVFLLNIFGKNKSKSLKGQKTKAFQYFQRKKVVISLAKCQPKFWGF